VFAVERLACVLFVKTSLHTGTYVHIPRAVGLSRTCTSIHPARDIHSLRRIVMYVLLMHTHVACARSMRTQQRHKKKYVQTETQAIKCRPHAMRQRNFCEYIHTLKIARMHKQQNSTNQISTTPSGRTFETDCSHHLVFASTNAAKNTVTHAGTHIKHNQYVFNLEKNMEPPNAYYIHPNVHTQTHKGNTYLMQIDRHTETGKQKHRQRYRQQTDRHANVHAHVCTHLCINITQNLIQHAHTHVMHIYTHPCNTTGIKCNNTRMRTQ